MNLLHYDADNISFNTMFQIIPMPVAIAIGVVWLGYVIYASGKLEKIKDDFTNPIFYITFGIMFLLMFFTKDNNAVRSQTANKHALLAAIAAYFGHLNIWFAAFLMGGALIYYTWDEKQIRNLEINWGMNPYEPLQKVKKYNYIGEGWDKEKQAI